MVAPPAQRSSNSLSQRLGAFAVGLRYTDLPSDVVEKAKVALLHNLTAALGGERLVAPAVALMRGHGHQGDGPAARILVGGDRVDPRSAAFANALLVTACAQDDVNLPSLSHIGTVVVPTVLALGEEADASGEELLAAMVTGYEVTAALGASLAAPAVARGFRPVLAGQIGAAVAGARLMGASTLRQQATIALAAGFGAGTNQTWISGTPEWQYQTAATAQNAVLAALLAGCGVRGGADALDGPLGVYMAFAGGREGVEQVATDLGEVWRIRETTFKPYPVCTINQVPVQALIEMARESGIDPALVAHVELTLNAGEARYPGVDAHGPFVDAPGALMSAPYCLAVALREGTVRTDDLFRFEDPELDALVQRIDVAVDDTLGPRSCRIRVTLTDGAELATERLSTADTFNWDREQAARVARATADETRLDPEQMDRLIELVLALETHGARELVDRCCPR